jgi:hypothetical protein
MFTPEAIVLIVEVTVACLLLSTLLALVLLDHPHQVRRRVIRRRRA